MNKYKSISEIKTETNIGKRILAGLIDYALVLTFFYFFASLVGEPNNEGGYTVTGWPMLIPIFFWLFMTAGIEQLFGATFGNLTAGLKPISTRGFNRELSFGQSIRRHLFDPIDMFPFGLVGIVIIQKTKKNQRVGDIWGETIVIKKSEEYLTYANNGS